MADDADICQPRKRTKKAFSPAIGSIRERKSTSKRKRVLSAPYTDKRLFIGEAWEAWQAVKKHENLTDDKQVACLLLRRYSDHLQPPLSTPYLQPPLPTDLQPPLPTDLQPPLPTDLQPPLPTDAQPPADPSMGLESDSYDDNRNHSPPQTPPRFPAPVTPSSVLTLEFENTVYLSEATEDFEEDFDEDEDDPTWTPGFKQAKLVAETNPLIMELPEGDSDEDEEEEEVEEEDDEEANPDSCPNLASEDAAILYRCSLQQLLDRIPPVPCTTCGKPTRSVISTRGTAFVVDWVCLKCDYRQKRRRWRTQPLINKIQTGDFMMSTATVLSGNQYEKVRFLLKAANIGFVSFVTFDKYQAATTYPVVQEAWAAESARVVAELSAKQEKEVLVCDARCDSPGYCAKYSTYSFMRGATGEIITMTVTDKRETKLNSGAMELLGFKKNLEDIKKKKVPIGEIVVDAHPQISKYMAEKEPDIVLQRDVWHGGKAVNTQIRKYGKSRLTSDLLPWAPEVVNHFWWCSKMCGGDTQAFKDLWLGILHHVANEHEWLELSCGHEPMPDIREDGKDWLPKGSPAHDALRKVVTSTRFMRAVPYYVNFRHNGQLETHHNTILKYANKRTHYEWEAYKARMCLAALDTNAHVNRPHRLNKKTGQPMYYRSCSKRTGNWSAKVRKVAKTYPHLPAIRASIVGRLRSLKGAGGLQKVARLKRVRTAGDPRLIAPNIASKTAPPTKDLVALRESKTRF